MEVEFDPDKASANLKKHGVAFSDAEAVFFDPLALTREDRDARDEARNVTLGMGALGDLLTVVWTLRGDNVRLISARKATANERKVYGYGI